MCGDIIIDSICVIIGIMESERGFIWTLEEILIDVKENIDRENSIGVNVTFPEQEESRNIRGNPRIFGTALIDDSLLLVDVCIGIGGEGEVVNASAVAVAAAIRASEMVLTMDHVRKD